MDLLNLCTYCLCFIINKLRQTLNGQYQPIIFLEQQNHMLIIKLFSHRLGDVKMHEKLEKYRI